MQVVANPNRSPAFRLITVAASGLGSFVLGLWGLKYGFGTNVAGIPIGVASAIVASLCALAAGLAALSFFAGVDESANYVYKETHYDKLTGLLARSAMVGKIAEAAARTVKTGQPMFLIDIDIDRFKQINDAIGYSQGDELILAFASRLKACLPEGVTVGRIGAGEFAVLYPDSRALASMESVAELLIEKLMEPYQLNTHLQSVNLSVGIVAMPKDGKIPRFSCCVARTLRCRMRALRGSGTGPCSIPTWARSPTTGSGSSPSCIAHSNAATSICTISRSSTC